MQLPLLDYDRLFFSDPDAKCIPYGMETFTTSRQAESFMNEIFLDEEEEVEAVSFNAACECRHIKGNYYIGIECPQCKTTVRDNFSSEIKFRAWLELPDYIPPMLHPAAYWVFKKWMGSTKGVFLLDSLLDVTARDKIPADLIEVTGCGYRNFHDNFDKIMMYLLNEYPPFQTTVVRERSTYIPEYLERYRDLMFIKHVPILNSNLHLMTSNGTMQYIDATSPHIFKCIVELSNLEYKQNTGTRPELYLDQQTWSIYSAYFEYVYSIVDNKLSKKPGYIRRHMVGSRVHFTSRAVILPITGEHDYDEIYIPWRIGVAMYGLELHNILVNRFNLNESEAHEKRHNALFKYDEDIAKALQILIDEAGHIDDNGKLINFKGLPIIIGRNPTLNAII